MMLKLTLKKTIEKISDLEQDNYKHLKQWLEKDEKTFVSTKNFFHRTKKEMKRSLKLTITKAMHPEGTGARPRRGKSSTRAYPTLPTTEEEADENETNKTKNWVDNKSINRAAKKEVNTKEDVNTKPPDYDQSIGCPHNTAQANP